MPTVWTIPANGGESIVESYGYRTDVLDAYTNAEQRVQQRGVALESLEFGIMSLEARESQLANATIFAAQDEVVVVPLWQYGSRLTVPTLIGSNVFQFGDALEVPYRVNGYAVMWSDPFTWELFTVFDTSIFGVATNTTATKDWPTGSLMLPGRRARLGDRVSLRRDSTRVLTGRVRFTMEQDLP